MKDRAPRDFKKDIPCRMREWANEQALGKRWQEKDTAFCTALTEPTIVPEGHVKRSHRDLRYAYGVPGAVGMLRYCLRSPKGKGDRPLLVFLHGAGCWGYDGWLSLREARLLRILRRQNYHLLVPQLGHTKQGIDNYNSDEFAQALKFRAISAI